MTLKTRKPTGKPVWPMLLVAGGEKTGKTYTAAQASTSSHIGRTFWFAFGEDEPDEYGVMPGCRIEIVEHDGTIPGLIAGIEAAKAEPAVDGKPNLIVLDSATRLWNFLSDTAQHEADARARNKAQKYGSRNLRPDGDNDIGMDLWNKAKTRHARVVEALRTHQGPVILTARMETVTVMDSQGKPTKDKDVKFQSEKTLPYDVGAIVEFRGYRNALVRGVRSLRWQHSPDELVPVREFTVESLWTVMGLADATDRSHATVDAEKSVSADERPDLNAIKGRIASHCPDGQNVKAWATALFADRNLDASSPDDALRVLAELENAA